MDGLMRTASISRQTKETRIELTLDLDRPSDGPIQTGSGFLDHMLDLLRKLLCLKNERLKPRNHLRMQCC